MTPAKLPPAAYQELLRAGLSVIPTDAYKAPQIGSWREYQKTPATKEIASRWSGNGVGVLCGAVSNGLFCIDIDEKNDPKKSIYKDYTGLVMETAPELMGAMVIQATKNGGYHLIARCSEIIKNQKLAHFSGVKEAVIETRGDGGYFCAAPTPGYTLLQGTLDQIDTVTPEELKTLLDCARAFNEVQPEEKNFSPIAKPAFETSGDTPLDDYDNRTQYEETIELLKKHGWTVKTRRGDAYQLCRPDKKQGISATLNHVPGRFYCFSTSTEFKAEGVYKQSAVYAMLEHRGNYGDAAKALYALGFGARHTSAKPLQVTASPSPIAKEPIPDFISQMEALYRDGMRKGVSTGWKVLDEYYQVVKGQLNIFTGIPSHGKSEFTDALMVNLSEAKGWHWVVYSPENYPISMHGRKLVEKHTGKNMLGGESRLSLEEFRAAASWVNDHFTFLDGLDEDMTLDTIFGMVEKIKSVKPVDGLIIDPWNELESFRPDRMTETEYIGNCLKRTRMFARKYDIYTAIVAHPFKMRKDPKTNETPVPNLYDISGSAHWYNKADNGITVFRDFEQKVTRIHILKIKFKYYGKIGEVELKYNPTSGRYYEPTQQESFAGDARLF
jgi:hypothetical protein